MEITLDGALLMRSRDTASERALARRALELHGGAGLRVLIGGLGLGYTALEALAHGRVARVEVVEYLPQVVDWLRRGLVPAAGALDADPRLIVVEGDVYRRLAEEPGAVYDVVLVDVDHSPDEWLEEDGASPGFYTAPGLERARRHLAPGGVLAVWSWAAHPPLEQALRCVFGEVAVEPVTVFNHVLDEEQTDWLFLART